MRPVHIPDVRRDLRPFYEKVFASYSYLVLRRSYRQISNPFAEYRSVASMPIQPDITLKILKPYINVIPTITNIVLRREWRPVR